MTLGNLELAVGKVSNEYDTVVLLVDDQAIIGEAVRRALANERDIDLHYCGSPLDALEIAVRIKPTVILQDLAMPEADGLDLVKLYRKTSATRDIPIIVLSAKEEPAVKSEAFAVGANDYLVKLPDKIELIARIRHHSRAFLNLVQRDEAHRALRESQQLLLEKNLELERLTNVDGLTGLNTRRYFNNYMTREWTRSSRSQTPLAVLMIDVDDFKRFNDTYGHLAGDEVLKDVAESIQFCCKRPTDIAARFGGEEFIVCLSGLGIDAAVEFAERIRATVADLAISHKASLHGSVTLSIGVAATIPHRGESYLGLIHAADTALYSAKRNGKNRVAA